MGMDFLQYIISRYKECNNTESKYCSMIVFVLLLSCPTKRLRTQTRYFNFKNVENVFDRKCATTGSKNSEKEKETENIYVF